MGKRFIFTGADRRRILSLIVAGYTDQRIVEETGWSLSSVQWLIRDMYRREGFKQEGGWNPRVLLAIKYAEVFAKGGDHHPATGQTG